MSARKTVSPVREHESRTKDTNTDKFAYICSYAPYTETDEFRKNFLTWSPDAVTMNKKLKPVAIGVGTDEHLYESVGKNISSFKEKGLKVNEFIVRGGHTWMNCRLFLAKSLEQLVN